LTSDRRVKYTEMVLKQTLIALLADKPITKITTTEICALADVNRGTFYSHFTDQYHLLRQIQDDFAADVRQLQAKRQADQLTTTAMLTELAEYFHQQLPLCRVLFTTSGGDDLIAGLIRQAYGEFLDSWRDQGLSSGDVELLYSFISHGAAAVLRHWLLSGSPESPSQVADLIIQVSTRGSASFRR